MPSYSKYTYRHTTGALLVFVRTWRTGSCCTIRDVERQHFNALCFGFASASVGGDCVRIYMPVLTVGLGKLLSVYLLPSARAIFHSARPAFELQYRHAVATIFPLTAVL